MNFFFNARLSKNQPDINNHPIITLNPTDYLLELIEKRDILLLRVLLIFGLIRNL